MLNTGPGGNARPRPHLISVDHNPSRRDLIDAAVWLAVIAAVASLATSPTVAMVATRVLG